MLPHMRLVCVMKCVCVFVQEPVVSSGHICRFEDMQVVSVLLDEIMKDPENPTEDLLFHLDIKVVIADLALFLTMLTFTCHSR